MGQYYLTINISKKQFLHPHNFNSGLKLLEFSRDSDGLMTGLALLLSSGNGRGGGDLYSESELIGSWAGDKIIIAGDYSDNIDFSLEENKSLYDEFHDQIINPEKCNWYQLADTCFQNISNDIIKVMCEDSYIKESITESFEYYEKSNVLDEILR